MDTVKDFLKAIRTDIKAKELMKGMKEPDNADEAAEQYAGIAKNWVSTASPGKL